MRPFIIWHWNRLPSLREADNQIKSFSERGFSAAVIVNGSDFMTEGYFEALRGSCRSAGRYGVKLLLSDDSGAFGGHCGGEVVSAAEFRARAIVLVREEALPEGEAPLFAEDGMAAVVRRAEPKNGICPADVFNPRAVSAFIRAFHRRLKREAARFMGYELAGLCVKAPFSPDFWETDALPYSDSLAERVKQRLGIDIEKDAGRLFSDENIRKKYNAEAEALCAEVYYGAINLWCAENGLKAVREEEIKVFSDSSDVLRGIYELSAEGAEYIAADGDCVSLVGASAAFSQRRPCAFGDKLWTDAAERLSMLFAGRRGAVDEMTVSREDGKPAEGTETYRSDSKEASAYLFCNGTDEPVSGIFRFPDNRPAFVYDIFSGESYFAGTEGEIKATLEVGGLLAVLCGTDADGGNLPRFLRSGVVFSAPKKPRKLQLCLAGTAESLLRLEEGARHEFEVLRAEGELYAVSAAGGEAVLNGAALKPCGSYLDSDFTKYNITELARLGQNELLTAEGAAFVVGETRNDGKELPPSPPVGASSGTARYFGLREYEVTIPDGACGGSCLRLRGSFALAEIKIGLRRERLCRSPFMISLYDADAGKTAKIKIYSDLLGFPGELSGGFGLTSAEIC